MSKVFHPSETVPVLVNTAEVEGKADLINGVFGSSRKQTGVVGQSETFVGVLGDGELIGVHGTSGAGTGVSGESSGTKGIGVHGRGGRLAGLFEGNVEVTGSLTVRGSNVDVGSLLERIAQLEQQEVNVAQLGQLSERVSTLERKVLELLLTVGNLPPSGAG